MIHQLKTLEPYFDAVASGHKTFEIRRNDRHFQVGDYLELVCVSIDPYGQPYTKKTAYTEQPAKVIRRQITYILYGGQFGIEPGFVVLGLDNDEASK